MSEIEFIGKCLVVEDVGERVLVIGDLHFGSFGFKKMGGVDVGSEIYEEIVKDLDLIFAKTGRVDKIVLLGDVKSNFSRLSYEEREELGRFFDYLKSKSGEIIIVRGNHDNYLLNISEKRGIKVLDYYVFGEICFLHGDKNFLEIYDSGIKSWVMGHGHPAVRLSDGIKDEKYKCFLDGKFKGRRVVIVPSFIGVNEGSDPRDYDLGFASEWEFKLDKFNVNIVSEDLEVKKFGELGKL
tara:strand:- start:77 stop:793 length:717 start_codon:yes stop_codon:yes gene_type:complete